MLPIDKEYERGWRRYGIWDMVGGLVGCSSQLRGSKSRLCGRVFWRGRYAASYTRAFDRLCPKTWGSSRSKGNGLSSTLSKLFLGSWSEYWEVFFWKVTSRLIFHCIWFPLKIAIIMISTEDGFQSFRIALQSSVSLSASLPPRVQGILPPTHSTA